MIAAEKRSGSYHPGSRRFTAFLGTFAMGSISFGHSEFIYRAQASDHKSPTESLLFNTDLKKRGRALTNLESTLF